MSNVVDLFAGAGGMSCGFEQAGFDTILGVDNDEKAVQTYRHNIPAPCLELDLSKRPELPLHEMHVKILVGGPPCQGFSISGKRDSDDDRNELVRDFLHYVETLDPKYVVMENVTGILSMKDGAVVKYIHNQFNRLGYGSEHYVLDASDYGVPQRRERVFFIASRDGPVPTIFTPHGDLTTVSDALEDVDESHPNHTPPQHQQTTRDRIADTKPGEQLYDSYAQRIRLDENNLAPTVVCGGPRPQWQLAHPTEDRGLTVHERALLQTFPTDWVFHGGVVSGRVQTGNAVPPNLARSIAAAFREKQW